MGIRPPRRSWNSICLRHGASLDPAVGIPPPPRPSLLSPVANSWLRPWPPLSWLVTDQLYKSLWVTFPDWSVVDHRRWSKEVNRNAVSNVQTRVVFYREKTTLSNIHETSGVSWHSRRDVHHCLWSSSVDIQRKIYRHIQLVGRESSRSRGQEISWPLIFWPHFISKYFDRRSFCFEMLWLLEIERPDPPH